LGQTKATVSPTKDGWHDEKFFDSWHQVASDAEIRK
jgi:hypothetical protein